MSHEFNIASPHAERLRVLQEQRERLPAAEIAAPIDPEQVRAADAVFSQQQKESDKVLGLIGLWTGTLLMHDIARETFDKSGEEKEEEAGADDDPHLPNH
jgi:hypothetical protein